MADVTQNVGFTNPTDPKISQQKCASKNQDLVSKTNSEQCQILANTNNIVQNKVNLTPLKVKFILCADGLYQYLTARQAREGEPLPEPAALPDVMAAAYRVSI